ncbi:hypothetical protein GCM10027093_60880 [Paraburkholderia jirisanensis]
MLSFELQGDEVRKRQLAGSWHYKLIETVGPLMVLPDLAVSGTRTLLSLSKASREVGETGEEATQAAKRLADQREAIDNFVRSNLDNPNQLLMRQQANKMREQAGKLADSVRVAQKKVVAARRELMLLRTIEAPAYLASIYGTGVYGVDPPEPLTRGLERMTDRFRQDDSSHPAQLLAPQNMSNSQQSGDPSTILQFQVGVAHRTGRAK